MFKTIIKEAFILLLLCIAIVLILGILFYDYIPTNRVIPEKEAYYTPENVKTEINEQITEMEKVEISYEITDADLSVYKQTSSYKPGKPDPFSLTETNDNAVGENDNTTDTTGNGTTTNSNTNSTNTFFDNEGLK